MFKFRSKKSGINSLTFAIKNRSVQNVAEMREKRGKQFLILLFNTISKKEANNATFFRTKNNKLTKSTKEGEHFVCLSLNLYIVKNVWDSFFVD